MLPVPDVAVLFLFLPILYCFYCCFYGLLSYFTVSYFLLLPLLLRSSQNHSNHTTWSFLLAPVPAILAARAFGKRIILNYHSGEADDHLSNWGSRVHPFLRLVDDIVVPSVYLKNVFESHGYTARGAPVPTSPLPQFFYSFPSSSPSLSKLTCTASSHAPQRSPLITSHLTCAAPPRPAPQHLSEARTASSYHLHVFICAREFVLKVKQIKEKKYK